MSKSGLPISIPSHRKKLSILSRPSTRQSAGAPKSFTPRKIDIVTLPLTVFFALSLAKPWAAQQTRLSWKNQRRENRNFAKVRTTSDV
jgi:hypothetical protein